MSFGSPAVGFSPSTFSQPQPTQAPQASSTQQITPEQHFQLIKMAYDSTPQNAAGHFRKLMYNVIVEGDVPRGLEYLKQQYTGVPLSLWNQAMQNNSDPTRLLPIPITSFTSLNDRVQKQQERFQTYNMAMSNLKTRLSAVGVSHEGPTMTKLNTLRAEQANLSQRLLQVMEKIQLRKLRGFHLSVSERELNANLRAMLKELAKPDTYQSKLSELSAVVGDLPVDVGLSSEYAQFALDDSVTKDVNILLSEQAQKLKIVTDLLSKDLRDMQTIQTSCRSAFFPGSQKTANFPHSIPA
jgi:nuclear pore complex protein Nup54